MTLATVEMPTATCDEWKLPASSAALTTAAELMYFTGAPLAHVVQYEEEQRANRLRHIYRGGGALFLRSIGSPARSDMDYVIRDIPVSR